MNVLNVRDRVVVATNYNSSFILGVRAGDTGTILENDGSSSRIDFCGCKNVSLNVCQENRKVWWINNSYLELESEKTTDFKVSAFSSIVEYKDYQVQVHNDAIYTLFECIEPEDFKKVIELLELAKNMQEEYAELIDRLG